MVGVKVCFPLFFPSREGQKDKRTKVQKDKGTKGPVGEILNGNMLVPAKGKRGFDKLELSKYGGTEVSIDTVHPFVNRES